MDAVERLTDLNASYRKLLKFTVGQLTEHIERWDEGKDYGFIVFENVKEVASIAAEIKTLGFLIQLFEKVPFDDE